MERCPQKKLEYAEEVWDTCTVFSALRCLAAVKHGSIFVVVFGFTASGIKCESPSSQH